MIYKYDGIGKKCPVPLINMRLLIKKMQSGDECIISINDAGSLNDIPKLLDKQGYQYRKQMIGNGTVEISISV
ncbi:MAG: sulfurtransferase TusA family protein [Colwellia sp.]|uniref:sulfurtransferase TusA family protein n=1 Tax=Colwellia sp. TaxID=56799 RepID=UPI001DF96173|nr:sulfurtransferase TusA family protein [Colwellia sp.]NQY50414.1 sulfurtransferase TusA family protein [Colwellia sp.]